MRTLIVIARLLSALFRPLYFPLVGFVLLFTLTSMSILPWQYKAWALAATYVFTIGLPALGIYLYRRVAGVLPVHLRHRRHRPGPYLITLLCYVTYLHLMHLMHMPHFLCGIITASLSIQTVCLFITLRWKISMHSAGVGGVIGGLVAYSALYGFNPVWWLCGAIVLDGLVMSSRMLLRQHSLPQVLVGSLVGVLCGYLGVFWG